MELKLNKWIYGCVAVLMLAAAWIFTRIDGGEDTVRYEQHLEEPDEAGLGEKPQSDGLVTHLPIISIDTGGETIPGNAILNDSLSIVGTTKTADGKDHIMAHMEVISGEGGHQLSDTPEVSSDITIHIRGNSSRRFDKKNYRPQGCPSRSAVQQALNFIKSGQKPRNYAVSGVFPFQMV